MFTLLGKRLGIGEGREKKKRSDCGLRSLVQLATNTVKFLEEKREIIFSKNTRLSGIFSREYSIRDSVRVLGIK